jgi:hypothetical protein
VTRATAVWAAALVVLAADAVSVATGRMTHGFIAYYAASRLLVDGELGAQVYDDAWFIRYAQELTGTGVLEVFGPNPPAMALLALPVVAFDPVVARAIWLAMALVAFAVATHTWIRRTPLPGVVAPAAVLLLMLNPSVWANLRTAQTYLFIFAAYTAVVQFLDRRDGRAGVAAGLALATKSSGAAWWALLLIQRRWRFAAAAALTVLALSCLVLALTGLDPWLRYPQYVAGFVQRPGAASVAYQTTWSLARHLCTPASTFNPAPAADCGAIATVLPPSLVLGAWLLTAWAVRRGGPPALAMAAGVCLALLALPVAAEHHFILLPIPLLLLIEARRSRQGIFMSEGLVLVLFLVLFLVPLTWTSRFTDGWWALLAYPRLYAAWLMWGAILVEMRSTSVGRHATAI